MSQAVDDDDSLPNIDADPVFDVARSAGRGGLALSGAKVFFIILGLLQQIVLFRVIGMASYGALRSALSPASITYNPIVTTGIQGMSQVASHADPKRQAAAIHTAFKVHAWLGTLIALAFFSVSPWLAEWLGAPHITRALQLLSVVIFLYGLYAPLIGVLNGRRQFLHQAGLDMSAAVLRTVGLITGGWICVRASGAVSPVNGAILGFVVSALLVLLVALSLVGIGKAGSSESSGKAHLQYIYPVFIGQVVLNLLLQADLNTLRYFASQAASAAGRPLEDADPLIGAYSTAQLFGFLPYQLLVGISFILFPMLSKAHQGRDREAIRHYVRTGVRIAVLITGFVVSISGALSSELLHLVFSGQAADLGALPMQILVLGLGAFAVFGALITVLNSLQQQWQGMIATAAAFALVLLLNTLLVHGQPFGPELLWRTAISTTIALFLATALTAVLVKRSAGGVVAPSTVVKVLLAVGVSIGLGRALPESGKLVTLPYSALVAAIYVAILVGLGELGRADLQHVRSIVSRRGRS